MAMVRRRRCVAGNMGIPPVAFPKCPPICVIWKLPMVAVGRTLEDFDFTLRHRRTRDALKALGMRFQAEIEDPDNTDSRPEYRPRL